MRNRLHSILLVSLVALTTVAVASTASATTQRDGVVIAKKKKKKKFSCSAEAKDYKRFGYKFKQRKSSGGVKLYIDSRKKSDREALFCSDKSHVTMTTDEFPGGSKWKYVGFYGYGGRCALLIAKQPKTFKYYGKALNPTLAVVVNLKTRAGAGRFFHTYYGSGNYKVSKVKWAKNCVGAWVDTHSSGSQNLSVLSFNNAKNFNVGPGPGVHSYKLSGGFSLESLMVQAVGKIGATVSWTDSNGARTRTIED